MKRVLLTGAAVLLSLSTAAFAQTTSRTTNNERVANERAAPERAAPERAATMNSNGMNTNSGGMFATVPSQDEMASKVVGLEVYNSSNEDVGKIKDVAFDQSGVHAYIVAVGGFAGMGDRYVAVAPSAIRISYDGNAKKWHAAMNTNADQLKSAPEYKYSSNG
jgi:hypothetical protein